MQWVSDKQGAAFERHLEQKPSFGDTCYWKGSITSLEELWQRLNQVPGPITEREIYNTKRQSCRTKSLWVSGGPVCKEA